MIALLALCLFAPHVHGGGLHRRGLDLAALARNSPVAVLGIKARGGDEEIVRLPYSEVPMASISEINMDAVPAARRKCFHVRRFLLGEGVEVKVDISTPLALSAESHCSLAEGCTVNVGSSKAQIDSSRLGWSKESTSVASAGASFSSSGDGSLLPGFFRTSATVSANYQSTSITSEGKSGDTTKSREDSSSASWSYRVPFGSNWVVATWVYTKHLSGTCTTIPFVDAECYNGAGPESGHLIYPSLAAKYVGADRKFDYDFERRLSGNISVLAFAATFDRQGPNADQHHKPLAKWGKPLSDPYWDFDGERRRVEYIPFGQGLGRRVAERGDWAFAGQDFWPLPLRQGIHMHPERGLVNRFEGKCHFNQWIPTAAGQLDMGQAVLVYSNETDWSPPPPKCSFTAVAYDEKTRECDLGNGWAYFAGDDGIFYYDPDLNQWLNQKNRPKWLRQPEGLKVKCPKLVPAASKYYRRSDDPAEELLDRIMVINAS